MNSGKEACRGELRTRHEDHQILGNSGDSQESRWLAWILGIKSNTDRIHHAVEIVEKANKGWKKLRESDEPTKIGHVDDYYFGLVEALEYSDIFRAFEKDDPKVIGPKLQRALSGPLRPADETAKELGWAKHHV